MSNEINGWGTFSTVSGPTVDVIDFTGGELIGDDPVETTTNSNGDIDGGVRSFEPAQMMSVGNTMITVAHSLEAKLAYQSLINVKDTMTLTSKSGGSESGAGWVLKYTPSTSTAGERPTAVIEWVNSTGTAGTTLPTITVI